MHQPLDYSLSTLTSRWPANEADGQYKAFETPTTRLVTHAFTSGIQAMLPLIEKASKVLATHLDMPTPALRLVRGYDPMQHVMQQLYGHGRLIAISDQRRELDDPLKTIRLVGSAMIDLAAIPGKGPKRLIVDGNWQPSQTAQAFGNLPPAKMIQSFSL